MSHNFFTHSAVDRHSGGFHVLAVVNSATVIEGQIAYDITYMCNLKETVQINFTKQE